MSRVALGLAAMIVASVFFVSCDSLTGGGPKKVIVSEGVCDNVIFLNMKLGQETNIILDNSQHRDDQESMALVLREFPIIITSELPADAQVGPTFTTVRLSALAGEEDEITLRPTLTGRFTADCEIVYARESGDTSIRKDLVFQIID